MKKLSLLYFSLITSLAILAQSKELSPSIRIEGVTQMRIDKYTKNFKLRKRYDTKPLGFVKAKIKENENVLLKSTSDSTGNYSLAFNVEPNKDYLITFSKKGYFSKNFLLNTNGISAHKQVHFKGWDFHLYKRIIGLEDSIFKVPTRFYYDSERGYMTYDEEFNVKLEIDQENQYIDYLRNLNNNDFIDQEEPIAKSYSVDKGTTTSTEENEIEGDNTSKSKDMPKIQLLDMKKLLSDLKLNEEEQDSLIENKQQEISNEWQQLEIAKIKATTDEDKLKIIEAQQLLFEKEQQIRMAQSEIKDAKKQIEMQALENKNKNILLALASSILLLVLALLFVLYKNNKERVKSNILLTMKNKEVMDSITYAQRLQNAILPPAVVISENLKESFILYMPKDIVSGDFYWVENIGNKTLFAVVDCTGHGVPGAFMSIVAYNALNQAVNQHKLIQPAEILNQVNIDISNTLHQSENIDVEDGMDIALCLLDKETNELEYAGAHNGLNLLQKGELKVIKADKFSIGSQKAKGKSFTNHQFLLEKGDYIYIFSDGYADQFGGDNERKFMYKKLRQLLIDNSMLSLDQQKENLIRQHHNWKGNLEQVDDICIMGVKIA